MTQTIEQLQARVEELEKDLADARKIIDEENKDHIEQLAASQAEIKRLRDALAWAKSGFNQASMGIIIQRELEELFNLCRDALAQPSDTSALDSFVAEKVKEVQLQDIEQYRLQMAGISTAAIGYWKEGDSIHPDYDTPALRDVAKLYASYESLTRQRDLAVDAIRNILHYIDDRNEMRLMDEHVTDDDEANSAIEYNEQLDSAVNQMRTTFSTIKESE